MWEQMEELLSKSDARIVLALDKFIQTFHGIGDYPTQDFLESAMKEVVLEFNRIHESGEYTISEAEGELLLELVYNVAVSMEYTGDMKFLVDLKKW